MFYICTSLLQKSIKYYLFLIFFNKYCSYWQMLQIYWNQKKKKQKKPKNLVWEEHIQAYKLHDKVKLGKNLMLKTA